MPTAKSLPITHTAYLAHTTKPLTAIGPSEELRTLPMGMFYAVTNANELELAITENRKSLKAWSNCNG